MRCCLVHERLLVSSHWPFAKSPSSRQRENKTDPFSPRLVFRLLWSFHGISKIRKEEKKKPGEHLSENPTLSPCCVVHVLLCFEGLVPYFPSYGFTLHLHTELMHSICKNHLLKQTYLLVWCSSNRAIICHRHMPHCAQDTGLLVPNPQAHHSLDPCDVTLPFFEDLFRLLDYLSQTSCFFLTCVFKGRCALMCPSCCFDITAEIARQCQQ